MPFPCLFQNQPFHHFHQVHTFLFILLSYTFMISRFQCTVEKSRCPTQSTNLNMQAFFPNLSKQTNINSFTWVQDFQQKIQILSFSKVSLFRSSIIRSFIEFHHQFLPLGFTIAKHHHEQQTSNWFNHRLELNHTNATSLIYSTP